jgi:hypothetical protein
VAMRKHNIQKVLGFGAIVVLVGVLAAAVYAQPQSAPGRQGPRMGILGGMGFGGLMDQLMVLGGVARQLNVTPEQQQGIRQLIRTSNLPQLRRGVATARQSLADAIINGQDSASAANQLTAAQGQLMTLEAQIASQIFQTVLSEAQRGQAKQLWNQRQQRRRQIQGGQ